MSEQQVLDWIAAQPPRNKKSRFTPRVTTTKNGKLRIRQTTTVVTFDAMVDPADIPSHLYDRRLWVIELCRDWYERIHEIDRRIGMPYPPFGTEELALANRFADAVIAKLAESEVS